MAHDILTQTWLTALRRKYNRRRYLCSDPIEPLYRYDSDGDREVVGIIASSLAYGRVAQIQRNVDDALSRLGPPRATITGCTLDQLLKRFRGFKHRFTTDEEMASLLFGLGQLIQKHGSLGACFADKLQRGDTSVLPALTAFADEVTVASKHRCQSLIPRPSRGSACKRLNLYLRWMIRRDAVDLGVWRGVPASKLIVPLDTHMHRIGLRFGLTRRQSADMKTALDITRAFKVFAPRDPIKYDFALTRLGILGVDIPSEESSERTATSPRRRGGRGKS